MTDQITVSRELLQQVMAFCEAWPGFGGKELATALRTALEQPVTQTGVGNSGFDYKTAADFMSGKEIDDERVRRFVSNSRWAFDNRESLQVLVAALRRDVVVMDAEIALLKQALLDAEALEQPAVEPVAWLPMDAAPKDGSLIRLLVNFDDHATEDGPGPHPTIGSNTSENDGGPDDWQFAGWNWEHDCYTQGVGTPVGWLPMTALVLSAQQPAPVQEPVPLLTDEEVSHIAVANAIEFHEFARAIEAAVRQKAGIK